MTFPPFAWPPMSPPAAPAPPAASVDSEFWAPPAVANPNDREFTENVAPAGMLLLNTTLGPVPTIVGTPSINRTGVIVANQLYMDFNVRRSWMRMQPPFDGNRYVAYFPITPDVGSTYRARLSFSRENGNENNGNPICFLFVAADGGGGLPDFNNYLAAGQVNADPRVWEFYSISGGAATLRKQDTVLKSEITQEWEFYFVKSGVNYKIGIRAGGDFLNTVSFAWAPTIAFWGIAFGAAAVFNAGQMNPIIACDYLRYEPTDNPVL